MTPPRPTSFGIVRGYKRPRTLERTKRQYEELNWELDGIDISDPDYRDHSGRKFGHNMPIAVSVDQPSGVLLRWCSDFIDTEYETWLVNASYFSLGDVIDWIEAHEPDLDYSLYQKLLDEQEPVMCPNWIGKIHRDAPHGHKEAAVRKAKAEFDPAIHPTVKLDYLKRR